MSINLITGFGLDFQFGPKSPVFSFDLRISGTPYQFGNSGSLPLGTEKEYRMMIREFSTTFQVGVVQTVNWFDKKLIKN